MPQSCTIRIGRNGQVSVRDIERERESERERDVLAPLVVLAGLLPITNINGRWYFLNKKKIFDTSFIATQVQFIPITLHALFPSTLPKADE